MKTSTIVLLAAGAVLAYLVVRSTTPRMTIPAGTRTAAQDPLRSITGGALDALSGWLHKVGSSSDGITYSTGTATYDPSFDDPSAYG